MAFLYLDELVLIELISDFFIVSSIEHLTGRKIPIKSKVSVVFIESVISITLFVTNRRYISVFGIIVLLLTALSLYGSQIDINMLGMTILATGIQIGTFSLISLPIFPSTIKAIVSPSISYELIRQYMMGLNHSGRIHSVKILFSDGRFISGNIFTDSGCTLKNTLITDIFKISEVLSLSERESVISVCNLSPPVDATLSPITVNTVGGITYLCKMDNVRVELDGRAESISLCVSKNRLFVPSGFLGFIGEK